MKHALLNARTFASLRRHRNYRLYFIGQVVSLSGTWMQNIALAWVVVRLTHDPVAVGRQCSDGFGADIDGALLRELADARQLQRTAHRHRQLARSQRDIAGRDTVINHAGPEIACAQRNHALQLILQYEEITGRRLDLGRRLGALGPRGWSRLGRRPLIERRVDEAEALLRETREPIKAIAFHLGFHDSAHFCRQFRRSLGHTPLAYRRRVTPPPTS